MGEDGRWVTRHCSSCEQLKLNKGDTFIYRLHYPEVMLGNGKYVFSPGIYKVLDLDNLKTAKWYDLLSRSFSFEVINHYPDDASIFMHPSEWKSFVNNDRETS